jgi:hypothetical protein
VFLPNAQLKTRLAAMLKYDEASLPDYWDVIIADANESAYGSIISHFLNRGFTQSQIDAWDQGEEYQRDIGLFWCLVKGGGLHNYDPTFVKLLDRRNELKEIQLETLGTPQEQEGVPDVISAGPLDTECDKYRTMQF